MRITADLTYDLQVDVGGEIPEDLPKLHLKLLYPAAQAAAVAPLIKIDSSVRAQGLKPILSPSASKAACPWSCCGTASTTCATSGDAVI